MKITLALAVLPYFTVWQLDVISTMSNEHSEELPTPEFLQFRKEKEQRSISILGKLQGIEKIIDLVGNEEEGWLDEQIILLNSEKLMCDILDRLEALREVTWAIKKVREKSGSKDDHQKQNALVEIKNKLFIAAVAMTMSKLGQPPQKQYTDCCEIETILSAYSDEGKLTDGRGCLLTHWAMLAVARPEYGVTEADVKTLVTHDPMSM